MKGFTHIMSYEILLCEVEINYLKQNVTNIHVLEFCYSMVSAEIFMENFCNRFTETCRNKKCIHNYCPLHLNLRT